MPGTRLGEQIAAPERSRRRSRSIRPGSACFTSGEYRITILPSLSRSSGWPNQRVSFGKIGRRTRVQISTKSAGVKPPWAMRRPRQRAPWRPTERTRRGWSRKLVQRLPLFALGTLSGMESPRRSVPRGRRLRRRGERSWRASERPPNARHQVAFARTQKRLEAVSNSTARKLQLGARIERL